MYLLIVALLCLVLFLFWVRKVNTVTVASDVDGNSYTVLRGEKPSTFHIDSANALAKVNLNVLNLIEHLQSKYPDVHYIRILKDKYNYSILSEAPIDRRYTTYTIDKKDIHICLRTRDTNERLYDVNLLMYVVLHELAHLCNYTENNQPIIGHGPEFTKIFRLLVREAATIGVYQYSNYKERPQEYCGIVINSSVY